MSRSPENVERAIGFESVPDLLTSLKGRRDGVEREPRIARKETKARLGFFFADLVELVTLLFSVPANSGQK